MTLITGNTYPVKEKLKALGGRWDKQAQGWNVPDSVAEEARAIVAAAGPGHPRGRPAGRRNYQPNRTAGPCEDAPCCGCCGPQGDGDYFGRSEDY